jgi:DNA-binding MarR family transcriptional regulator
MAQASAPVAQPTTAPVRAPSSAPAPAPAPAPTSAPAADPRLRAWVAFLQAHSALSHRLEAELQAAVRISLADYDALVQLATADQRRLRMSELAESVLLSRSGVSRLVDRMERKGWVERATCPTDARGAWAILTAAGLETLRSASPVHLGGVERHFLSQMDDADRAGLTRALEAVLAGLGSNPAVTPGGGCTPAVHAVPAPSDPPPGA